MPEINEVIGIVFSSDGNSLNDDDTPETIPNWDSITHIIVLSSLEEEFGITFSDEEMTNINTIGEIRRTVAEKIEQR
jgi:acyl carrier protein